MKQKVNRVPDVGKWIFDVWKIDHFCFTPLELTISEYEITLIIRTGKHVFKWEHRRK